MIFLTYSLFVLIHGICFVVIKTELQTNDLKFKDILNFNHKFRTLNPKYQHKDKDNIRLSTKMYDNINDLSLFIKSIVGNFEDIQNESIYYDRMFTYSYVCIDKENWNDKQSINKYMDEFYKYQYVLSGEHNEIFNLDYDKINKNTYSRWRYSMYGFSKESGVILASDQEIYNYTKLPHQYEGIYFYIMIFAFYQRISLLIFSQNLLSDDKTEIMKQKQNLDKFVNYSWFSQITNSEHGMDLWNNWKDTFELQKLFDEVHREYMEYYDSIVMTGQDRINSLLILLYTISVVFSGLTIVNQHFNLDDSNWFSNLVIYIVIITVLIYPAYLLLRAIVRRLRKKLKKKEW